MWHRRAKIVLDFVSFGLLLGMYFEMTRRWTCRVDALWWDGKAQMDGGARQASFQDGRRV